MRNLQKELQELLQRNLLINPFLKEKLIKLFQNPTIPDSTKAKLLSNAKNTDKKEKTILKRLLTKNPHFFKDFNKTVKNIQRKKLSEKESLMNQKELSILEKSF